MRRGECGLGFCVFCQAEDGRRDLVRSRGLGDVYKRQVLNVTGTREELGKNPNTDAQRGKKTYPTFYGVEGCLLYTSDAADERSSVDLGGRRFIKKKNNNKTTNTNNTQTRTA